MILNFNSFIYENHKFNPHNYNSFSELTDIDLKEIAQWGLEKGYSSGAFDDTDGDINKAIDNVVDSFKILLSDKFPDGFNEIPNDITIYRMVVLNDISELNTTNVGYSWFSNKNRINDPDFKQQLWHLKSKNLYLLTAVIQESQIDIARSLLQRDMIWLENEIVLKNDTNIKIISVDKL